MNKPDFKKAILVGTVAGMFAFTGCANKVPNAVNRSINNGREGYGYAFNQTNRRVRNINDGRDGYARNQDNRYGTKNYTNTVYRTYRDGYRGNATDGQSTAANNVVKRSNTGTVGQNLRKISRNLGISGNRGAGIVPATQVTRDITAPKQTAAVNKTAAGTVNRSARRKVNTAINNVKATTDTTAKNVKATTANKAASTEKTTDKASAVPTANKSVNNIGVPATTAANTAKQTTRKVTANTQSRPRVATREESKRTFAALERANKNHRRQIHNAAIGYPKGSAVR
jgi:hypothetical protein